MKILTTIRSFLNSRLSSSFCLSIAIAIRTINVFFVSYAGRDKMFLVLQSKSLLEGNGLSIPGYLTSNSETPIYNFTPLWPPGYPIVLAPFLKIFNYDVYWATSTLDIIVCIAFIFLIRIISRQLGFPLLAVNLMTIIAGCFEYTFINESLPTDTISLVFFLAGISFALSFLNAASFSRKHLLLASFFLFVPGIFRYSFPAVSLAVGIGILFIGFLKKDLMIKKKGLWLFIVTGILIGTFLLVSKLSTGHMGYATPTSRGFFPENIVHWFPVVPSSFINIAFFTSQVIRLSGFSLVTIMQWLELISGIVIVFLTLFILHRFILRKSFKPITPYHWFLVIGFWSSVALFALLGYLSLTYEIQKGFVNNWNYIYEARYFSFVFVYLQFSFFIWVFLYPSSLKNIFLKFIASLCFLALFIEVTHNIYFHTKVAFDFKKYKSEVYRERDYVYFVKLIGELEKKYPGYGIWVAAPGDSFYPYTATYYGHTGIADAETFKNNVIKVKGKTVLVLMLYDDEVSSYNEFLSRSTILVTNKIDYSNYYVIELVP